MTRLLWLTCAALAGAGTMIIEMTAPRLFQPWFGATTFVWTNVIGVVLVALATGYWLGGRLAERQGIERRCALLLLGAAALAVAMPFLTTPVATWLLPDPLALGMTKGAGSDLAFGSLAAAALLLMPAILALGMVTPQIVKILALDGMPVGRASGETFMAGTLGSLAGTFLPTYVLVPHWGSRASMFVAAALLTISATAMMSTRRRSIVLLSTTALLALAWFGTIGHPMRPALPGESLLAEVESQYQYIRVVRAPAQGPDVEGRRELLLRMNEGVLEYHSVTVDGRMDTAGKYYDTLTLFPAIMRTDRPLAAVVLGSGAGTTSRLLEGFWPGKFSRILNVDVDPSVIDLEGRFRSTVADQVPPAENVRASVVTSVAGDARTVLRRLTDRFDLVVLDAYARQIEIPFHLATREFFELVLQRLAIDGLLVANVSTVDARDLLTQGLVATLSAAGFGSVGMIPVEGFPNVVLWASPEQAIDLSQARVPTALERVVRHARRYGRSLHRHPAAPIFTDDSAPVEHLGGQLIDRDAP